MEFFDVLHMRQSVRSYTDEKVADKEIEALVEAAQLAPVGMHNSKGYVLTVITSESVLTQMKTAFSRVSRRRRKPSRRSQNTMRPASSRTCIWRQRILAWGRSISTA